MQFVIGRVCATAPFNATSNGHQLAIPSAQLEYVLLLYKLPDDIYSLSRLTLGEITP